MKKNNYDALSYESLSDFETILGDDDLPFKGTVNENN